MISWPRHLAQDQLTLAYPQEVNSWFLSGKDEGRWWAWAALVSPVGLPARGVRTVCRVLHHTGGAWPLPVPRGTQFSRACRSWGLTLLVGSSFKGLRNQEGGRQLCGELCL